MYLEVPCDLPLLLVSRKPLLPCKGGWSSKDQKLSGPEPTAPLPASKVGNTLKRLGSKGIGMVVSIPHSARVARANKRTVLFTRDVRNDLKVVIASRDELSKLSGPVT